MDFEAPQWLADDRAHRRKIIQEARKGKPVSSMVKVLVVAILTLAAFMAGWKAESYLSPLVYIAPRVAYAEENAVVPEEKTRPGILATITAYTSSVDETDDTPFETASGARTRRGVIACPQKYVFGTKVVINNAEYACEDRMNRRYWDKERFDIWVETKAEAYRWGVQEVEVVILEQ